MKKWQKSWLLVLASSLAMGWIAQGEAQPLPSSSDEEALAYGNYPGQSNQRGGNWWRGQQQQQQQWPQPWPNCFDVMISWGNQYGSGSKWVRICPQSNRAYVWSWNNYSRQGQWQEFSIPHGASYYHPQTGRKFIFFGSWQQQDESGMGGGRPSMGGGRPSMGGSRPSVQGGSYDRGNPGGMSDGSPQGATYEQKQVFVEKKSYTN